MTVTHMTSISLDSRIGELMRNGRTVYYVILGRAMVESFSRAEVTACLAKYAAKLPEWDAIRR